MTTRLMMILGLATMIAIGCDLETTDDGAVAIELNDLNEVDGLTDWQCHLCPQNATCIEECFNIGLDDGGCGFEAICRKGHQWDPDLCDCVAGLANDFPEDEPDDEPVSCDQPTCDADR